MVTPLHGLSLSFYKYKTHCIYTFIPPWHENDWTKCYQILLIIIFYLSI